MRRGYQQSLVTKIFMGYPCQAPDPFVFCVFTAVIVAAAGHTISSFGKAPSSLAYSAVFARSLLYGLILAVSLIYGCWLSAIYAWGLSAVEGGSVAGSSMLWWLFRIFVSVFSG